MREKKIEKNHFIIFKQSRIFLGFSVTSITEYYHSKSEVVWNLTLSSNCGMYVDFYTTSGYP